MQNQTGQIQTGDLTLTADTVDNTGGSVYGGNTTLNAAQELNNSQGTIVASGNLTLTTPSIVNAQGTIAADGNAVVSTQTLTNDLGQLGANGDLAITSRHIVSSGSVLSGHHTQITTQTLNNSGQIHAGQDLTLAAQGDVSNTGAILSGQNTQLAINNLTNTAEIRTGQDLTLTVHGSVTNAGAVAAGGDLTLTAQGVDNQTTGSIAADQVTVSTDAILANKGSIQGNHIALSADRLTNTGGVFGGTIVVEAHHLTNQDTGTIASLGDQQLIVRDNLENKDGALIYAGATLVVAGGKETDSQGRYTQGTQNLLNQSADIQAQDMALYVHNLTNKKRIFTYGEVLTSETQHSDDIGLLPEMHTNWQWYGDEQHRYRSRYRNYTRYIYDTQIFEDSAAGQILANNNMYINATGQLNNEVSTIAAGNQLMIDADSAQVRNWAPQFTQRIVEDGEIDVHWQYRFKTWIGKWTSARNRHSYTPFVDESISNSASPQAILSGSQGVHISAVTIENGDLNHSLPGSTTLTLPPSAGAPQKVDQNWTLPNNGLYHINPDPSAKYLVETDSRFTSKNKFLSSDYMLQRLMYDPERNMKRLGDGFYEQQLIREQMLALTGRMYLTGYTNNQDQYQYLLNNGIAAVEEFHLVVGVALNPEQMAQLTTDIVWLVEQEVEGQKVLVPVVYLAPGTVKSLTAGGAVIAGDAVGLTSSGDIKNSGAITGNSSITVAGDNVLNRGGSIQSGGDVKIGAVQDITNQSGQIGGQNIVLAAGGDIRNETTTTTVQNSTGITTNTVVNQLGSISAEQDLTLSAGNTISFAGGQASAGGDVTLEATDIALGTAQHQSSTDGIYKGKTTQSATTINIGSTITAGGNANFVGSHDITVTGSTIKADGNVALEAGHDVAINAAKDEHTANYSLGGGRHQEESSHHQGSLVVSGGNTQVITGNDLTVAGSGIQADGSVGLHAGNNVDISSLKDHDYSDVQYRGKNYYEEHMTDKESAAVASVEGGSDVTISAGYVTGSTGTGNINVQGAYTGSDQGTVTLAGKGDVAIGTIDLHNEQYDELYHKKSGLLSSTTTHRIDHIDQTQSYGSTVVGDSVNIISGNDLALKGSSVIATNDIDLSAQGNIDIATGQNSTDVDSMYYKKKSGLMGSGIGFSIGTEKQKNTTTVHEEYQTGSLIGSTQGNITITAGQDITVTGSDMAALGGNIGMMGDNITIEQATDTTDYENTYKYSKSGLTVSLGGAIIDPLQNAVDYANKSANAQTDQLQIAAGAKALDEFRDAYKTIADVSQNGLSKDAAKSAEQLSINVSIGSQKYESNSQSHSETVQGSHITAGGDVTLIATGNGDTTVKNGDITITGSTVEGNNVILDATAVDIGCRRIG